MNRIFPPMVWFTLAFLVCTLVLGLTLENIRDPGDQGTQHRATMHRLSGIAAALVVVLVNSIVVTYFIGTSRWCKEVVTTYRMDAKLLERGMGMKRRAFSNALVGMLVAVVLVATGGAADPGASRQIEPIAGIRWSDIHLVGALTGLAVIGWCFFVQWTYIVQQRELIGKIMGEVRRIRRERGLDDPAEEPKDVVVEVAVAFCNVEVVVYVASVLVVPALDEGVITWMGGG